MFTYMDKLMFEMKLFQCVLEYIKFNCFDIEKSS